MSCIKISSVCRLSVGLSETLPYYVQTAKRIVDILSPQVVLSRAFTATEPYYNSLTDSNEDRWNLLCKSPYLIWRSFYTEH